MLEEIRKTIEGPVSFKVHVKLIKDQAFITVIPEATQKELCFEPLVFNNHINDEKIGEIISGHIIKLKGDIDEIDEFILGTKMSKREEKVKVPEELAQQPVTPEESFKAPEPVQETEEPPKKKRTLEY